MNHFIKLFNSAATDIEVAWIAFIATLIGAGIAIIGGMLGSYLSDKRATERQKAQWNEEKLNRKIESRITQLNNLIDLITKYSSSHVDLVISIRNGLMTPQSILELRLPEVWELGGGSSKSIAAANILGDYVLVDLLNQLEDLYIVIWTKELNSDEEKIDYDYRQINIIYNQIMKRLDDLKIKLIKFRDLPENLSIKLFDVP